MEVEKNNLLYSIILGKKQDFIKEIKNLKNITQIEIDSDQNSILHFICDNNKINLLIILFEKINENLNNLKIKEKRENKIIPENKINPEKTSNSEKSKNSEKTKKEKISKKPEIFPQIKNYINKKNKKGYTALTYAVHNGNMVI